MYDMYNIMCVLPKSTFDQTKRKVRIFIYICFAILELDLKKREVFFKRKNPVKLHLYQRTVSSCIYGRR